MPNQAVDTDVLVVGAGPVGLLLANECARRGLRWRIIERRAGQSQHSKALAIFPRTLEILDMAGLAGPFLEAANRVTAIAVVTPRRQLARIAFAPSHTPYPFVAMVPQDVTERLLVEALGARDAGGVEYQTAFVTATDEDDAVRVELDRDGVRSTLTARFVVGCDGAHSDVRKCLGLAFAGGDYHEQFMLADVATNDALPADAMHLCPNRRGPLAIFPMSATRRRIVAMIAQPEGAAPSLELVRRLLRERAPAGIEASGLHWSGYFHIHHRRVAQLRAGRIFLAGDAAHVHSPFGGQGMNTGLHDAWNLAWKLDLALRGRATGELLDSYTGERIPVIRGVLATTHFLTRTMGTTNRVAEALRNVLIPVLAHIGAWRRALVARLAELDIAYRGSPVVAGAGKRHFEDSMRGGAGIAGRFLLLLGPTAAPPLLDLADRFANAHADIVELRRTSRPGMALVRPDGYVAWAGAVADAGGLASVRRLLERQSEVVPAAPSPASGH